MKKAWQKPTLETLDIKMTMWNLYGSHHDGAWNDQISNLTEPNSDGLQAEQQMS